MKAGTLLLLITFPIVALAILIKIWLTGTWEDYLLEIPIGFAGLIAFLFPHETGLTRLQRGANRNSWVHQPENFVRLLGAAILIAAGFSVLIYKLKIFDY